jgi:transposase InsO family protein
MSDILKKIYYDTSQAGSFGSVEKLLFEARNVRPEIEREEVVDWLSGQDAYTLHRKIIRKFERRPIVAHHVDSIWQIDLADVTKHSKYNNDVTFILVAIDVVSRYIFLQPLKNKSGLSVMNALEKIFDKRKPNFIQTDQGKEFLNRDVQNFLKSNNIHHYTTTSDDPKCALAERFIRTLREKMGKYFQAAKTFKYIDKLQNFALSYNNSIHSRLKMKPVDVTSENESDALFSLYGKYWEMNNPKLFLSIGDYVRISKKKEIFEKKSETANFTEEIFKISSIARKPPITTYKIEDLDGEAVTSIFYPHELVKVKEKEIYDIERVIKTKTVNGKKLSFVKWKGYPDKFNSWTEI